MTKKLVVALGLTLTTFLPAASLAKPKPTKQSTTAPKSSGSGDATVGLGTTTGLMKQMRVDVDGTISEIWIRPAGAMTNKRIKGCGAVSQAHPLLNWAFTEQRVVHISHHATGCFSHVDIAS